MNYWQTWLQMFSQTQTATAQNAATQMATLNAQISKNFTGQYAQQWQQACKQWQTSMEGAWTSPASFWQAVASIQSARARFIAEFCQQQPQYLAQLFQCTSYPQLVECLTRWNGHTLTALTNLNMVTQAQRTNLVAEWKHNMPALANPKALANMWNANQFWNAAKSGTATPSTGFSNFGNPTAPKSQSSAPGATPAQPVAKPQPQPAAQTFTPAQPSASSHSTMTPVTPQNSPVAASPISAHVSVPTPAPVASPVPATQSDLNLVGGTPTISSTANSVMRTAAGSTIASAAARRSVVARRSTNTRRRASR